MKKIVMIAVVAAFLAVPAFSQTKNYSLIAKWGHDWSKGSVVHFTNETLKKARKLVRKDKKMNDAEVVKAAYETRGFMGNVWLATDGKELFLVNRPGMPIPGLKINKFMPLFDYPVEVTEAEMTFAAERVKMKLGFEVGDWLNDEQLSLLDIYCIYINQLREEGSYIRKNLQLLLHPAE